MSRFKFILCTCILFPLPTPAAPGNNQDRQVISLIPSPRWELVSSQKTSLQQLQGWNVDPAIDGEYGVKNIVDRKYRFETFTAEALVEEASDPSCAYGLLTYYDAAGMSPVQGMKLTLEDSKQAFMARGDYFIRITHPANPGLSGSDFRSLLMQIGGAAPTPDSLSSLPSSLPSQGLVRGSEKYFLGLEAAHKLLPNFPAELIGFPDGAEAQLGEYASGREMLELLEIDFPTPQIARARFDAMQTSLNLNQEQGANSIYGERESSYVFLVLNSPSKTAAHQFLSQFKVSETVSWNQRYQGKTSIAVQLLNLILGNIALILILIGITVVGGLSMFLAKRFILNHFPNSFLAQQGDGEIIRLRLS
ncbi:MAG TPA: DUF6599 family protein [Terriglobia bacterium]|nr:DUF6599 family protein [Terriglobia bacterium]